ncbi:MAG: hypothetical protein GXO48_07505 [Chlorobi bacterium]|nr:hypothetical protein [Chlorobiota bacterium]
MLVSPVQQIELVLRSFKDALSDSFKYGWWVWMIIPAISTIIALASSVWLAAVVAGWFISTVLEWMGLDLGKWAFLFYLIKLLIGLTTGVFFYKNIALIILAPFFAWFSEKADSRWTGKEYPFRFHEFVQDVIRGIVLAIRNTILEILWIVGLWILGLIFPIVSPITGILLLIIQGYFLGMSMVDYALERRRYSVRQRVTYARQHKFGLSMIGLIVFFISAIPIVGWLIAYYLAILAGTRYVILTVDSVKSDG